MLKRAASYLLMALGALLLGWAVESGEERSDELANLLAMATVLAPLVVAHALVAGEALRRPAED